MNKEDRIELLETIAGRLDMIVSNEELIYIDDQDDKLIEDLINIKN